MEKNLLLFSLFGVLGILLACGSGEDDTTQNITAGDNSVIVSDNSGSTIVEVNTSSDEAVGGVQDAIEECCPQFIGLTDDDCIIQNYPGLPDDLCRLEPDEDGNPVPRPLRAFVVEGEVQGYWE